MKRSTPGAPSASVKPVPRFCRKHSEYLAARIELRVAELRVLAAETAYAYGRAQCSAATRCLLKPLRARSPEQGWQVWQHKLRLEATVRRRLRA